MCKTMCGAPCDFSVSPSPFGLDFGTLDLGLTIKRNIPLILLWCSLNFNMM